MKFNWTGDMTDECFCKIGGMTGHCELLCDDIKVIDEDAKNGDREWFIESWYVGVYRDYDSPPMKEEDMLFHSGEHGGMITSGEMARAIAEAVLRGYLILRPGEILPLSTLRPTTLIESS